MQINKMSALATPKENSYIVKKNSAEEIIDSKLGKSTEKTIMENAVIFARNNIIEKWFERLYIFISQYFISLGGFNKERIDGTVKWGYNIFERRVSVLERKIIDYIVVCINEFALSKNLTEQEAFRYLYANKGIEFLTENYDIEHTLSLQDAVNDLSIVCRYRRVWLLLIHRI